MNKAGLQSEIVLYPTGHHACGKSEFSTYLLNRYNFHVVETGAMVREQYTQRPKEMKDYSIGQFVTAIDSIEPHFFINLTVDCINAGVEHSKNTGIIVNGMRSADHLIRLKSSLSRYRQFVCWIDSPRNLLKERWETREGRNLTDEEFSSLIEFDRSLGLDAIRDQADIILSNDGSVEDLHSQADALLRKIGAIAING